MAPTAAMGLSSPLEMHWAVLPLSIASPLILTILFPSPPLFTIHVAAMSAAFLLFLPLGVFAAAKASKIPTKLVRRAGVRRHLVLQLVTMVLSLLGLAAMFRHRQLRNKVHFPNLHSWLGVASVILVEVGSLLGVLVWAAPANRHIRRLLPTHRLLGRLTPLAAFASLFTALKLFDRSHHRNKGWRTYVVAAMVLIQIILMLPFLLPIFFAKSSSQPRNSPGTSSKRETSHLKSQTGKEPPREAEEILKENEVV